MSSVVQVCSQKFLWTKGIKHSRPLLELLLSALQKTQSFLGHPLCTAHPLTKSSLIFFAYIFITRLMPSTLIFFSHYHTCCTYTPKYSRNIHVKFSVFTKITCLPVFLIYFPHLTPVATENPFNSEIKLRCFLEAIC